jgi:hypothetical protein
LADWIWGWNVSRWKSNVPLLWCMMVDTYSFTGDAVTVLGLVGVISTGIILVLCFTRYFNSPLRK